MPRADVALLGFVAAVLDVGVRTTVAQRRLLPDGHLALEPQAQRK